VTGSGASNIAGPGTSAPRAVSDTRSKQISSTRFLLRTSAVAATKRVVTGSWYPLASGKSAPSS